MRVSLKEATKAAGYALSPTKILYSRDSPAFLKLLLLYNCFKASSDVGLLQQALVSRQKYLAFHRALSVKGGTGLGHVRGHLQTAVLVH